MTHILIPMADMEVLKMLVDAIEVRADNAPAIKEQVVKFRELFASKQISLDEKDIEVNKKAKEVWINQVSMVNDIEPTNKRLDLFEKSLNNIYDAAYKQALKDLL